MPHQKVKDQREVPEFHFDFCFPGDEKEKETLTIRVVRERNQDFLPNLHR